MTEETKPEQDAMTPGRRAFEAYYSSWQNKPEAWDDQFHFVKKSWEAAAAAVIADAQKGGE